MTTFLKYSTKATERGVSDAFPDYLREKIITLKPTKSSAILEYRFRTLI